MKQEREAIRLLAIEYGIREAARRSNISENTVLSWSKRDQWFVQPTSKQRQDGNAISAIKPAVDAHLAEIEENKRSTKLSLSRYARRASQDSEKATLRDAPLVHKVAQIGSILWPEEQKANSILNIAILTGQEEPERTANARDIESECQGSGG